MDEGRADDTRIELDIELSRWGRSDYKNAQYVVQPYYIHENISRFEVPAGELTTFCAGSPVAPHCTIMTTPRPEKAVSLPTTISLFSEKSAHQSAADRSVEESQDFWQWRLQRMQELICELLFKNEQLRIELAGTNEGVMSSNEKNVEIGFEQGNSTLAAAKRIL